EVANTLGAGFLEKVYQRTLIRELRLRGLALVSEASLPVTYKGQCVGEYYADILVENELVIEIKCCDRLTSEHLAQCVNYLRCSTKTLCLLINFQRSTVEWKRVVLNYSIHICSRRTSPPPTAAPISGPITGTGA